MSDPRDQQLRTDSRWSHPDALLPLTFSISEWKIIQRGLRLAFIQETRVLSPETIARGHEYDRLAARVQFHTSSPIAPTIADIKKITERSEREITRIRSLYKLAQKGYGKAS